MRAFVLQCNMPFWVRAFQDLEREHGWSVALWCGALVLEEARAAFPGAIIYDSVAATRGLPCDGALGVGGAPPLDHDTLERMVQCEVRVLKMFERIDAAATFGYDERVRHYHRLLRYWIALFDEHRPDVVVFPTSPHMGYDYVVYELAKVRGVRTLMFDRTQALGLLIGVERFEDGPRRLQQAYRELLPDAPIVLSEEAEAQLAKLQGEYEVGMPFNLRHKLSLNLQPLSWHQALREALFGPVPDPGYDKLPGREITDARTERWAHAWIRYRAGRKRIERLAAYRSQAELPDLTEPYVFLALQVQPEKSTCPDGDLFVHQLLLVELLASCLPAGWRLLVKEHPSQFEHYKPGERSAKDRRFYAELAAIERVSLVPLELTSYELIDGARACAVTTGSVGIEALARGKPVLVFGHTWYRYCRHVYAVKDRVDVQAALAEIAAGVVVEFDDLRRFLQAAEQVGFWGYVDPVYQLRGGVSPDENRRRVVAQMLATLGLCRGVS